MDTPCQDQQYSDVCLALDEITLEVFKILEQISDCRRKLEDNLGHGFLQMSRARYSMGIKAIGAHTIPEEGITPLINISVCPETENFSVCLNSGSRGEENSTDTTLRKRIVENKHEESDHYEDVLADTLKNTNIGEDSKEKQGKVNDPLKWFGVLVPQSLRQSQASFKQSLPLLCELANLQNMLEQKRGKFNELMEKKSEFSPTTKKLETV